MEKIQDIKNHIGSGDTEGAIQKLMILMEQNPQINELLLQKGRINALNKKIRLGTIDHEAGSIEENQIRGSILELIEQFEKLGLEINSKRESELNTILDIIFKVAYDILQENQEILLPVFKSSFDRGVTEDKMSILFGQQTQRAYFRRWLVYLRHELQKDDVSETKKSRIKQLFEEVNEFTSKLYNKDLDKNKYTVCIMIKNRDISMKEISKIVEEYLDYLRECVDRIGEIVEEIKIEK